MWWHPRPVGSSPDRRNPFAGITIPKENASTAIAAAVNWHAVLIIERIGSPGPKR